MTAKDLKKYCGRGLPWRTAMVKVGEANVHRIIEEHALQVGANNAFESGIFGTITEIAVQMFKRRSKGHKLTKQDEGFLSNILEAKDGKESFVGAIAKAAAPKESKKEQGKGD